MRKVVVNIVGKVCLTVLIIMLCAVIWQVFSRFILQSPSTATDEISSFALIWVGLLGAAYATGEHLHLAIDLLPEKMVNKNIAFFDGFVYLSVFVFSLCVMIIGGARLCQLTFQFEQTSASLGLPLGFIYLIVPISGVLICYFSLDSFFVKIKSQKAS
ncbi:TRAP-type C4-dicarboxylate transport system, small permease component [Nonlabens sp. Hel1_33_55]|uniref:TRAP transporter small permease n=1 Tax=Nonlabens sp. Hel1_33_55 TaxID=1336802 RepID=UPI000875DFAA|nr:TRAP transporter small permease [Nonlabens sp. Hel1_33_55]SCY10643.1 TRAP-type C4-dicarboxylate transport system, small permease component [Nonlabens sp. Hel1_33_55]